MTSDVWTLLEADGLGAANYLEVISTAREDHLSLRRRGQYGFYAVVFGHHVLERGRRGERSVIRICGPGDLVGFGLWQAPFASERFWLRSLEPGLLHYMTRENYARLHDRAPKLSSYIFNALCRIIALKDARIAALERSSVKGRVCGLLLDLSARFGRETSRGRLIQLGIDRKTLAALAGTTAESFARTLTDLENDGLILRERRKVLITHLEGLERIT